jgi:hypothetical protein
MPDRYEREIEDILRNLKSKEEPGGLRPIRPSNRPRRGFSAGPQFNFPTWCLLIAVGVALLGGGWAAAAGSNVLTGLLALVGLVCLALVALSSFLVKQRPPTSRWR